MADYVASARSSYFMVKDRAKFEEALAGAGLPDEIRVTGDADDRHGKVVGIYVDEAEGDGAWPTWTDDDDEVNYGALIGAHLAEGEVCILMEIGAQKLQYLEAWALLITPDGREERIDLPTLARERAATLGRRRELFG